MSAVCAKSISVLIVVDCEGRCIT